jgi:hypothetical protein
VQGFKVEIGSSGLLFCILPPTRESKTMSFKVFDQAEQLARELETLEKEAQKK